ncbi:arylamine N-acetyltransferase [Streptomyces sp. NPDC094437]|uniref:arylamine N-acetyltransferase family protein n=1 Tax=Streptomyces sp. NPDC094437 TaxID=3366060 RepID=UPI003803F398
MDTTQVDAYLRRLGIERPGWDLDGAGATIEVLRELHLRHLKAVPFENLSVHLGEEIVLEEGRLWEKVVAGRRGGFCYELNGLLGELLGALGFGVTLLAARTYGGRGRLGVPYDHLALLVRTVDGGEWLADVGFGAHSHLPLAFGERGEQVDPAGTFRIADAEPDAAGVGLDLVVLFDEEPQYRLELRPRVLDDFVIGAWWQATAPTSHFMRSLVCSRITEDGGRITLSGRTLKQTGPDGKRQQQELGTDAEVLAAYRERFGIELDRVPAVAERGRAAGRV